MSKRTNLERVLGAVGGAMAGALFSLVWLLFSFGWAWMLALPPLVGAFVGYFRGDRGILALLRGTTLR